MQPPVPASPATQAPHRDEKRWRTGLTPVFRDFQQCVEASCCCYCQAARQRDVVLGGRGDVRALPCVLPFAFDVAAGYGAGTLAMVWWLRTRLRARYNIAGSVAMDGVHSAFCTMCVLAQHYREMSLRGECPGAHCIPIPYGAQQPGFATMD
jgi:Cys-rich protein (TIGR01571 family)